MFFLIVNEFKDKPFTIKIDGTPDCSKDEQITFIIRYVDDKFNIRERFIGFFVAEKTSGENLMNIALSVLKEISLF